MYRVSVIKSLHNHGLFDSDIFIIVSEVSLCQVSTYWLTGIQALPSTRYPNHIIFHIEVIIMISNGTKTFYSMQYILLL